MLGPDRRGSAGERLNGPDGDDCGLSKLRRGGSKELCWEKDKGFMRFVVLNAELPNVEGGAPAGVKDLAEDGGGPAGVVEGFEAANEKMLPPWPGRLSGVDGVGLEE